MYFYSTYYHKSAVYSLIIQASFPGHVGGARKLPENEATAVVVWSGDETTEKGGELVASFPGHVGEARKWPENKATAEGSLVWGRDSLVPRL